MSRFAATDNQDVQRHAGQQRSFASQRRKGYRRGVLATALLMLTVAGLVLVGLSPIALRSLANIRGIDWAKLSNVGQAYGTVSALLVVVGLSGVAITMLMQVRESHHSRVQAARNRQHDLVRMAIDDPICMAVIGSGDDQNASRQLSYANLWIQFWLMLWEFGDLSEAELRKVLAKELFTSVAGRHSWEHFRGIRIREYERRRHRRFYDILDQEYELAAIYSCGASESTFSEKRHRRGMVAGGIVVAAFLGVLVRRILRNTS